MNSRKPFIALLTLALISVFVIAATLVVPGRKIRDYQRVTALDNTDVFIIDDVVNNTNQSIEWSNIKSITNGFAGTNFVTDLVTTTSNGLVTFTTNLVTVTSNGLVSIIGAGAPWTNNGGILHPKVSNGQQTNSIQVYTNGGLSIGANSLPYWVSQPGAGGETLVSVRDEVVNFNEIFLGLTSLTTNEIYQDFFMHSGLNRRRIILETATGEQLVQDQYIDDSTNFIFSASGTSFGTVWKFQPGAVSSPQYFFDTVRPIATNVHIMDLNNFGTNKFVVRGDSHVGINTNEPSYPLHIFTDNITKPSVEISYAAGAGNTTAFQIRNGAGATNFKVGVDGLVDSATIHNTGTITSDVVTATSLNVLGGTLGAGKVLTDVSGTGAATWQDGVTLSAVTNVVTNYVNSIQLRTNFINLSPQAAKFPITNFPTVGSGYKAYELIYYKTNTFGNIANLNANWQFVVPPDYATNSLRFYMLSMLLQTNGAASSNTIFRASIFKSTSGDGVDIHTNEIFGAKVSGTNTWTASTSNTNQIQSLAIDIGTNALLQPGDFAVLNLERNATNDTYGWEVGVVGVQLLYSRP